MTFLLIYCNSHTMDHQSPPPRPLRVQGAPPPPPRQFLFTFSDDSVLRKMSARDLAKLRIWKGNRILNPEHKQSIASSLKNGVKGLDLKPFHIVTYPVEEDGDEEICSFVVDGQHRLSIIKESETQDFDVLVIEKKCKSESEVIQYFKLLNHTRAIEWKEDPVLVANTYIKALEEAFNTGKEKKLRMKATHRPYLYIEYLREELIKRKVGHSGKTPAQFVEYAKIKNEEFLTYFKNLKEKDSLQEKAIRLEFCLALDPKMKWLDGFE